MYICCHFPRGSTREMEGVRRIYVAIGNSFIFTNRSLVEYVLDSSTRGITTYLALIYCRFFTCFITRVTRPCDFKGERVFRELDPREWW